MIYLSGLTVKDENNPQGDIEIEITGLRSGEKLYEELLIGNNPKQTEHPKIMKAHEEFMPWHELEQELEGLNLALQEGDIDSIRKVLLRLVPGYLPELSLINIGLT
jgi:FlaA1/EpsC-like NDP-sugar epimerase